MVNLSAKRWSKL